MLWSDIPRNLPRVTRRYTRLQARVYVKKIREGYSRVYHEEAVHFNYFIQRHRKHNAVHDGNVRWHID